MFTGIQFSGYKLFCEENIIKFNKRNVSFKDVFKGVHLGGASLNCINFIVPMNIATPKLIQCGIAEMAENKAFHGFCGCGFLLFRSAAALHGLFSLAILNLFLTIGGQSLNL